MAETDESPQREACSEGGHAVSSPGPEPTEQEGPRQAEKSQEARNMAMLCHLLGIFGFFAPLVIWLSERDKHRFVDEHGREAMNYHVSLVIYCAALCLVVVGVFLLPVLAIVHIVLSILGTVKASRGQPWRYPIAIPFLK
jgi:uncharacterized Tic20 family protein